MIWICYCCRLQYQTKLHEGKDKQLISGFLLLIKRLMRSFNFEFLRKTCPAGIHLCFGHTPKCIIFCYSKYYRFKYTYKTHTHTHIYICKYVHFPTLPWETSNLWQIVINSLSICIIISKYNSPFKCFRVPC